MPGIKADGLRPDERLAEVNVVKLFVSAALNDRVNGTLRIAVVQARSGKISAVIDAAKLKAVRCRLCMTVSVAAYTFSSGVVGDVCIARAVDIHLRPISAQAVFVCRKNSRDRTVFLQCAAKKRSKQHVRAGIE